MMNSYKSSFGLPAVARPFAPFREPSLALAAIIGLLFFDSLYIILVVETGGWMADIKSVFPDERPIFRPKYLLRSGAIAMLSCWWVAAVAARRRAGGGVVGGPSGRARYDFGRVEVAVLLGASITAAAFLAVFLIEPGLFARMSHERRAVEVLTAMTLIASAGLFFGAARRLAARATLRKAGTPALAALVGLGFFVVGMEELSWMQQVFRFETPTAFRGNIQNETNLHNYASQFIEVVAYSAATALMVVLPYLNQSRGCRARLGRWAVLVPGPLTLCVGSLAAAFTYDLWNVSVMQFCFFVTLAILIDLVIVERRIGPPALTTAVVGLVALTQALLLCLGQRMEGSPNPPTEYKEFFFALAAATYAFELLRRADDRRSDSSRPALVVRGDS